MRLKFSIFADVLTSRDEIYLVFILPSSVFIVLGYSMKAKHPDRNCLSGYYGISVSAQFQKHRTIALKNILLFLLPLLMYSLISTSNSSDLTVSVMKVSTSIALQRNTKQAAYITNPYAHQHSASFHNNYLFTKFLIQCFL